MPAIIALILSNLPELIKLGQAGYNLVIAARLACQQSGEWTADMELEFQSKLAAEKIDPAWLPDAVTAPVAAPVNPNAQAVLSAVAAITPLIEQIHAAVTAPAKPVVSQTDAPLVVSKPVLDPDQTQKAGLTPQENPSPEVASVAAPVKIEMCPDGWHRDVPA